MTAKYKTYIGVFFEDKGKTITKFVTGLSGSTALWEDGKPAMNIAESWAKDVVLGLTFNGYAAAVIKVIDGVILTNPEKAKE